MMMRKRSCLVVVFFFFAIVLFLSASTTKIFLVSAVHSDDDEKNDDEGKTKEKEESWQDKDRDEYGLPICHDETLRRSPLRRATGGEIAAKMSQAKRYVDGHVRVSRDGKEMHVDVKVIRVKGNLNVGRNLYFEGEVKVEGSVIMGNKKDALEEIKRLENEIEEMTAIVEELEGHHTLTDENFHTAIENCLTMNNGQHRKDGACEALHYGERIGDWDVGKVSNFTRAFTNRAEFNADLSRWNTSSATSFDGMFENAVAFNGDVSKWKSKSATTKDKMFRNAVAFKSKYLCAKYTDAPEDLSSCADVSTDWVAPSPPPSAPSPPSEPTASPPPKPTEPVSPSGLAEAPLPPPEPPGPPSPPPVQTEISQPAGTKELNQRFMPKVNGWYELLPEDYSGAAQIAYVDYDGSASGIEDEGPWIQVKYAKNKFSRARPWSALGKGDPSREDGTAYSGNFEFAQDENWIDKLLDQAVDVRQRFVSWGKRSVGWNYEYDYQAARGFNDVNYTRWGSGLALVGGAAGPPTGFSHGTSGFNEFLSPASLEIDPTNLNDDAWRKSVIYFRNTGDEKILPVRGIWNADVDHPGEGRYFPLARPDVGDEVDENGTFTESSDTWVKIVQNFLPPSPPPPSPPPLPPLTDAAFSDAILACLGVDPEYGNCPDLEYGTITEWFVQDVTNFASAFKGASQFIGNISKWNTASATSMRSMFSSASAFNQDIGDWNTEKVTTMFGMFYWASAFNHNISSWTGSAATTAQTSMFLDASAFRAKFACTDAVTGPASSCNTIKSTWVAPPPPPSPPPSPQGPPGTFNGINVYQDGDGWFLLLAYNHFPGEDKAIVPGTAPQSPTESYSHVWLNDLGLTANDVEAVRFYCKTSEHDRIVHFSTELAYTKQTIVYGTLESNSASYWNTGTTKFADHTGQSPDSVNDYWGMGGGQPPASCGSPSRATCTTYFSYPFYKWGSPHNLWHIGSGNYLCDDDNHLYTGISETTTHQIWFKKKQ